ncbi:MAG: ribosome small subunit-dependent GTPase A [Saprospiraceae bacterium]|nr:ribosome small subunit-dependent GTPase A [Saprospiraceae bacterium]
MTYEDLGYSKSLQAHRQTENLMAFEVGRVIAEHRERYTIKTPEKEYDSELIGKLRFTAESRHDFPAVGDWVAFSEYDEGKALIHEIYPRHSSIERKAVGKSGQVQIIATNIDVGLIVQAVNRDFNINRLERYLTICHASKVEPIIVLSKIDLVQHSDLQDLITQITKRLGNTPIITVSNQQLNGYSAVQALIEKGRTYCLLGSSGVGKSTLLNHLSGEEKMKTGAISDSVNKGKHTTSHRELIVLEGGGILIDNPGMREVGITDTSAGLEATFDTLLGYAAHCRYKDCTHLHEKGCAIIAAVESGEIEEAAYHNFQKMEREREHFESSLQERRKKDREQGKLYKSIQEQKRKAKYS